MNVSEMTLMPNDQGGMAGIKKRIYCDYAATAPLLDVSREALLETLDMQGNPSSLHGSGRAARRCVEEAREVLAAAVGAHSSEIIFTSGGTEADNLAVKGLYWQRMADAGKQGKERRRIMASSIEHPAVMDSVEWLADHEGAQVDWIPVNSEAAVDYDFIAGKLEEYGDEIALISVMWANNEVGTIQPIQQITALAAEYGVPVHSDAVQALGVDAINFKNSGLAAMTVSGHKIGAPLGIGALVLSRAVPLVSVQHGGGQERGVRSGTLDVASARAFAAAAHYAVKHREEQNSKLTVLRDRLIAGIQKIVPDAVLCGSQDLQSPGLRLPGQVHFIFPGCEGDSILFLLDQYGIDTSAGSACNAGVPRPSHVLLAMGFDENLARSGQRFSFGSRSVPEDVDAIVEIFGAVHEKARAAGMSASFSNIETPRMHGMDN